MSTALLLTPESIGTDDVTTPTDDLICGEALVGKIVTDAVALPERDLAVEPPTLRAENVNPRELRDNPRNLRTSVGDLTDLKASMAVVGILCPLVVIPITVVPVGDDESAEAEQFQIIIGHRRKHAAIELGMAKVPCVVAADEGAALQIVAQLAENGHRVGLTATEEAEAYHQLTLLEWSPEQIGRVRAIPATQVRKTLRLRELPQAARQAADAGTLTLDDAALMAEFADEPAVLGRILKAGGAGWGFRHAIATERSKRDATVAKERVKAELVIAGVKVTGKPKQFGYGGAALDARQLVDAAGERLDPAQVRARPGFAAFVERDGNAARAVVYCTDPDKYGYAKRNPVQPSYGLSETERAAREEAERAREAMREGLTVAEGVRREFYRQAYGTARAAKRLFIEALRETVTNAAALRFNDLNGLYGTLGGADADVVAAAKEDRLRRCLVARWICAHENNLRHAATGRDWALDTDAAAFWLDQLVADGYHLGDAESTLRQHLTADTDDADEGDADDEEDEGEDQRDDKACLLTDSTDDGVAGNDPSDRGDTSPALDDDIDEVDVDLAVAALLDAESVTTA